MLTTNAPIPEVNLLRPLSLPALERELLTMQALVRCRRHLPAEYWPLFDRCCEAWEFYRPTQPAGHKAHIDRLIAQIYGGVR